MAPEERVTGKTAMENWTSEKFGNENIQQ